MAEDNAPKGEFAIQRLYVKDISFESPRSPKVFVEEWKPELDLDLNSSNTTLEDDNYEVILSGTATVKVGGETAFIAEVKQAGVFTIKDFDDEQRHQIINSFCSNVLFPYLREVITDIVNRGGFPQLVLAPVNFDALYQEQMSDQKQEEEVKH